MTTEITYAEVRFKTEPNSSGTPAQTPTASKEKTSPPSSNTAYPKLLLATLLILLLLTISFLIAFIMFYQKYSELVKEENIRQELTHTTLECKKLNLTMKRKSWSCCPNNWKSFGSNCYFISPESRNWTESQKSCEEMQAHLLVVDTKEEQDFINTRLNRYKAYYLGLSDLKSGHWEWVNQTPYNHSTTFWHKGEPNNDNEHCVILNFRQQQGQGWGWNDIPCYNSMSSICEMSKIYLRMEHSP